MTTTFDPFPFPFMPASEDFGDSIVTAIALAAEDLMEEGTEWLDDEGSSRPRRSGETLTSLHNAFPPWLRFAHHGLNDAGLDSYGWPGKISDTDILARLLSLNSSRTSTP